MARFPFTTLDSVPGSAMPRLSFDLSLDNKSLRLSGIIDTGAALNVLPYHVGLSLGAIWEGQRRLGTLAGSLTGVESRALVVNFNLPALTGDSFITLFFAWANSDSVPVLLGQTNFLMEFNACFYRSQNYFEIWHVSGNGR